MSVGGVGGSGGRAPNEPGGDGGDGGGLSELLRLAGELRSAQPDVQVRRPPLPVLSPRGLARALAPPALPAFHRVCAPRAQLSAVCPPTLQERRRRWESLPMFAQNTLLAATSAAAAELLAARSGERPLPERLAVARSLQRAGNDSFADASRGAAGGDAMPDTGPFARSLLKLSCV